MTWRRIEDAPYGRALLCIDFNNPEIRDGRCVIVGVKGAEDQWTDEDGVPIHPEYKIMGWMAMPEPMPVGSGR